eukprot:gene7714-15786_t
MILHDLLQTLSLLPSWEKLKEEILSKLHPVTVSNLDDALLLQLVLNEVGPAVVRYWGKEGDSKPELLHEPYLQHRERERVTRLVTDQLIACVRATVKEISAEKAFIHYKLDLHKAYQQLLDSIPDSPTQSQPNRRGPDDDVLPVSTNLGTALVSSLMSTQFDSMGDLLRPRRIGVGVGVGGSGADNTIGQGQYTSESSRGGDGGGGSVDSIPMRDMVVLCESLHGTLLPSPLRKLLWKYKLLHRGPGATPVGPELTTELSRLGRSKGIPDVTAHTPVSDLIGRLVSHEFERGFRHITTAVPMSMTIPSHSRSQQLPGLTAVGDSTMPPHPPSSRPGSADRVVDGSVLT